MSLLTALILAAAAAQPAPPPAPQGASVTVMATAEILRAETASVDGGRDGLKRQVRPRPAGQIAIEFE